MEAMLNAERKMLNAANYFLNHSGTSAGRGTEVLANNYLNHKGAKTQRSTKFFRKILR